MIFEGFEKGDFELLTDLRAFIDEQFKQHTKGDAERTALLMKTFISGLCHLYTKHMTDQEVAQFYVDLAAIDKGVRGARK